MAPAPKEREKTQMSVDYMMKESWLRDCCTEINVKQGPLGYRLNAENILADVSKLDFKKPAVLFGDVIGDELGNISYIKRDMNRREQAGKIPANSTKKFFNMLQEILHNVVDIAREEEGETETPSPESDASSKSDKQSENNNGEPQFIASLANAVRKTSEEPAATKKRKDVSGKSASSAQSLKIDVDLDEIGRSRRHVPAHNNDIEIDRNHDVVNKKTIEVDSECVSTDVLHVSDVCPESFKKIYQEACENNVEGNGPFNDEQHYSHTPEIDESDLELIADFEREFNNLPCDSEEDDQRFQRFSELSSANSLKQIPDVVSPHEDESQNVNSIQTVSNHLYALKSLGDKSSNTDQECDSTTMNTSQNLLNGHSTGSNVASEPMRFEQSPIVSNDFIGSESDEADSVICKELSSYLKQILHINGSQHVSNSQEMSEKSLKNSSIFSQHSKPSRPIGRGMSAALRNLRSKDVRPGNIPSSFHSSSHTQISKLSSLQSPPRNPSHPDCHPSPESVPRYQMSSIKTKEEMPSMCHIESSETQIHTRTRFRESPSSYSSLRHPRDPFDKSELTRKSNSSLELGVRSNHMTDSYASQGPFATEEDSNDELTILENGASRQHSHNKQLNLRILEDHSYASEKNCKVPSTDIAGADSGVESDGFHNYRPVRKKRNTSNGQDTVTSPSLQYLSQPAEDKVGRLLKTMIGRGRGCLNQQK